MRLSKFHVVCLFLLIASPAAACQAKLLLSWDASPSMSRADYELQRLGTANAFRQPAILNAISLSSGGIAVSLMQWSGPDEQEVTIPWRVLTNSTEALHFAAMVELAEDPYELFTGTAVGDGLRFARAHLAGAPVDCASAVIDISSDGSGNIGLEPSPEADALEADGVTVNALVISGPYLKVVDDPFIYYVANVSRGPGSFVVDVATFDDFSRALSKKILRELALLVATSED